MSSRWRKFIARPAFNKAVSHAGWLTADRFVRVFLSAVVGWWMAQSLGPERFGILSYGLALVSLLGCLAEGGLDAVMKRELLSLPNEAQSLVYTATVLRGAGALIGFCGLGVVLWLQSGGVERASIVLILGLTMIQPVLLSPDAWFQVRLEARQSTTPQWLGLALGTMLRVLCIILDARLVYFAVAIAVESLLIGVLLQWRAIRAGVTWRLQRFRKDIASRILRLAFPMLLSSAAVMLYMRIDVVMIDMLLEEHDVGVYAAAVRLSELGYFLPGVIASAALPGLWEARFKGQSNYEGRVQRYFDLNAMFAYMFMIPVALLAPWLVQLTYGSAYVDAVRLLIVHVCACPFVFMGVARTQILVNERRGWFLAATTAGGAVINIVLNALWLPRFGPVGAAYATVVSYAAAAWAGSWLHASVRPTAWAQTRALLIPVLGWRYLRRS